MQLRENHGSWVIVDKVLEYSSDEQTKFIALQILEETIKFRWKALPADQRLGIRNYVVDKVIAMSRTDELLNKSLAYVTKLDVILVQILKQEWPHNWPAFITELVNSSKVSESLCENNIKILKLLSEEVFDFSKEEMTHQKTKTMKETLNQEFRQIFELSMLVLEHSNRPSLITANLDMLLRYLTWIPLGYIFETPLIQLLLTKFLPVQIFRNQSLSCVTEIAGLTEGVNQYKHILVAMYNELVNRMSGRALISGTNQPAPALLPRDTDIAALFLRVNADDRSFVQRLCMFFTTFFESHLQLLEDNQANHENLIIGMEYLVKISLVEDQEIFKICLDYWNVLTSSIYNTEILRQHPGAKTNKEDSDGVLVLASSGNNGYSVSHTSPRIGLYSAILSQLRMVMISRMAKPEEVLVEVDDSGELVRETTKDTDAIALYKTMRETLVYLAHIDYDDTENIMLTKLIEQCKDDLGLFTWNGTNTLSWAIGSISGAMGEEEEKRFLVTVLKDLLGLCERVRGKDNKAVVATNIMYVVGQYPRFLRAHWRFLKTVVSKLFEFMHELHPGVRDMACDTFIKLAQKCKRKFVISQPPDTIPYIETLLQSIPEIISDLEPHQIQLFYEACAIIITAEPNPPNKVELLRKLMEIPNQHWTAIMVSASQSVTNLQDIGRIKDLVKILRINVRVCSALGYDYVTQLGRFYQEMLNVYKAYSQFISQGVAQYGAGLMNHHNIRLMRGVKTEVLTLVTTFISQSEDPQAMATQLLPPLYDAVLLDYQNGVPDTREANVLELFAAIVARLRLHVSGAIPSIFQAVFGSTLEMITKNFEDYPDHRVGFYHLLKEVISNCFESIFSTPAEMQKQIVDSIVWGFKHTERNVSDMSLNILMEFLTNVNGHQQISQSFYKAYLIPLIEDVLYVLTDRTHKSGFKMHATLLRHMFLLVEQNMVQIPLFDPSTAPAGTTNQLYVRQYVGNLLVRAFPNLGEAAARQFIQSIFDPSKDLQAFKQALRDFLVQIKEFSGEDNSELFAEEREAQVRMQQQALLMQKQAIPGMLKPNEIDDADI